VAASLATTIKEILWVHLDSGARNAGNMKPLFVGFSRDIVPLEMLVLHLLLLLELTDIRGAVGEIASYPSLTFSFVFSVIITAIDFY
jgi:hypothetical protein